MKVRSQQTQKCKIYFCMKMMKKEVLCLSCEEYLSVR